MDTRKLMVSRTYSFVSGAYIKMCEKAEEVQRLRPIQLGDWYAAQGNRCVCVIGSLAHPKLTADLFLGKDTWLPRQDQLQEMMPMPLSIVIDDFRNFCLQDGQVWLFGSMEQLWLAFVMRDKYNKVWDGQDWVQKGRDNGI